MSTSLVSKVFPNAIGVNDETMNKKTIPIAKLFLNELLLVIKSS